MGTVAIDVGDFLGHRQYQRELDETAHIRCENCRHLGKQVEGEEYHLCEHPERQPDARVILSDSPNRKISCGLFEHKDGVFGRLETLEHLHKSNSLTYNDVKKVAQELGLTLAEFGDGSDCSIAEAYCYWNQSGDRRDDPAIFIEYDYDIADKNGKKTLAGTVHFLEIHREETGVNIFKKLREGWDISACQFIQACRLSGLKIDETLRRVITSRVKYYKIVYAQDGDVRGMQVVFSIYAPHRPMSKKVWALGNKLAGLVMGMEVGI